ncbi:MAG: glutaredoxin 3 [Deltaproteobacteria bacterium]|nr:glutaredoxin 3 [Deltaproteobacteria bacterium]
MAKKVTIYTTNYCPYCHAAKKLLDQKGVSYQEINVEGDDVKRQWLVQKTNQRTVPQIFVDDQPYGGFDDISALDDQGKLDEILGL